jgi:hypothetical protein
MVIKYTKIFHSKTIQNLHKFGIFGLATLPPKPFVYQVHEKSFRFDAVDCGRDSLEK